MARPKYVFRYKRRIGLLGDTVYWARGWLPALKLTVKLLTIKSDSVRTQSQNIMQQMQKLKTILASDRKSNIGNNLTWLVQGVGQLTGGLLDWNKWILVGEYESTQDMRSFMIFPISFYLRLESWLCGIQKRGHSGWEFVPLATSENRKWEYGGR